MNILQTLLAHPLLGPALPVIAATLPVALLLAFAGFGFMIGSLQVTGAVSKRSAYDKAARQMAAIALILGWIVLIGSRIYLFFSSDGYVPTSLVGTVVELSWGVFGFAVIALSIHFAVWRFLANHRICHSLLAFLAGIHGLVGCLAIMGALRLRLACELPNADQIRIEDLFNFSVLPSPLFYALVMTVPLALAMPSGFGLVWLAVRRSRDDYGRDYYTSIMRWVARWGFIAWIPVVLLAGGIVYLEALPLLDAGTQIEPMTLAIYGCRVLPALLACIMLCVMRRSALPMRLRPLTWLIVLFSLPAAWFLFEDATTFVF